MNVVVVAGITYNEDEDALNEEEEEALTCAEEALSRTNADLARLYIHNLYTLIAKELAAESWRDISIYLLPRCRRALVGWSAWCAGEYELSWDGVRGERERRGRLC